MAENPAVTETTAGRRVAAWAVDFALVLGCAALLGSLTHYRIADYLSGWVELGGTGAWEVIRSNGDWGGAGKTFGMDVVNSVLMLIIQAFVALIVATFLYQFVGFAWKGATFGRFLLDLEVRAVAGDDGRLGRARAARRALAGTMTDVGLYSFACIALLAGRFALSVALWVLAVAVLATNALFAAGASRRSLVDRLAGTAVARSGLLRESWHAARDHAAVERGIRGARAGFERVQATTGQIRESERVAQLRDLGQDAGRRGRDTARQALSSERGQQARRAAEWAGASLKGAYDKRRDSGRPPGR
ncbi:RDD family protein [Nocardia bovistercoris]|uniref:RDD family protein n=1 Tax=Nocardia bovistercoris TaxID=2785916 RepID=A0A931N447_9NOCA|nr:RDD family protein [Nocardia bovistercoris]MBH0777876.1 RDD family protein [Nocardia bovistercoris]